MLPRIVVKPPCLQISDFKDPGGQGSEQSGYHCALSRGTEPNHFQRSSPTSTSCDSVVSEDRWEFCKTCQFQFTRGRKKKKKEETVK